MRVIDPRHLFLVLAVQQLQAENQQLKLAQAIDAAKQQADIQKTQISKASDEKIAAAKNQTDLQKQWIAVSAQLLIAAGKVGAENARSLAEALDRKDAEAIGAILEVIHKDKDQVHEHIQNSLDRQHEKEMARIDHAHALQQGAQQVAGALVQGQQDAALQPTPAE